MKNSIEQAIDSLLEKEEEVTDLNSREALLAFLGKTAKVTENPEGTVDVEGDVNIWDGIGQPLSLKKLPFQFGTVTGDFVITVYDLTSLQGAPKQVRGNFDCHASQLTSLQGAPEIVGGDFICSTTNLTSLQGAPKQVSGNFWCSDIPTLTSLQGAPKRVGGDFDCNGAAALTSLQGAPEIVGGDFDIKRTPKLTSLEGLPSPEHIGGELKQDEKEAPKKQAPKKKSVKTKGAGKYRINRSTSARGYWTQKISANSAQEAAQKANEDPYLNATEIEYESEDDDITDAEEDDLEVVA